jgi:hypothetical protein
LRIFFAKAVVVDNIIQYLWYKTQITTVVILFNTVLNGKSDKIQDMPTVTHGWSEWCQIMSSWHFAIGRNGEKCNQCTLYIMYIPSTATRTSQSIIDVWSWPGSKFIVLVRHGWAEIVQYVKSLPG